MQLIRNDVLEIKNELLDTFQGGTNHATLNHKTERLNDPETIKENIAESQKLKHQYSAVAELFPNHIVVDEEDTFKFHDLTESNRRQSVCKDSCRLPIISNETYESARALSEAISADVEKEGN